MTRARRTHRLSLIAGAFAIMLAAPAVANATVTATQITNLSNPSHVASNDDALPGASENAVQVMGVTNGTAGDTIKIVYRSLEPTDTTTLAYRTNVAVLANGSFSTTIDVNPYDYRAGYLLAVPTGFAPASSADFASFAPISWSVDGFTQTRDDEIVHHYYYEQYSAKSSTWFVNWDSCGLYYMYLTSPTGVAGNALWDCNDTLMSASVIPPGASARPAALIDGVEAIGPARADRAKAGAPEITWSHTKDIASGDLVIHEVTPLVKCMPSPGTCTYYASTGVSVVRDFRTRNDGTRVDVEDHYRSTDGADHTFDVVLTEWVDGPSPAYTFPGSGFATHTGPDEIPTSGWPAGWSATAKRDVATDDSTSNSIAAPYGATAFSEVPSRIWFTSINTRLQQFTGVVRANTAGWQLRAAYSMSTTNADANASATQLSDWTVGPSVAFGMADHASVSNGDVTVSGTASDNVGVASVTVNGVPAAISGGNWSVRLPIAGATALTAVARDAQGNVAEASITLDGTNAPVRDTIRPVVKVKKFPKFFSLQAALKSGIGVSLTCSEKSKASAKATMPVKSYKAIGAKAKKALPVRIGTSKAGTCIAGRRMTLHVMFSKAAKRRLAKLRRTVKTTITLTVVDTARNTTTKAVVATIKYVPARKRHVKH
jgi:hypothetical protein